MKQITSWLILFLLMVVFLSSSSCTKDAETISEQIDNSSYESTNKTIEKMESVQLSVLIKQEGLEEYYRAADTSIKDLEEYSEKLEDEGYNIIRVKDLLDEAKEYLADAENAILFDQGNGALSLLLNAKTKADEGIEKGTYLENTRSEENTSISQDSSLEYENNEFDNSQNEEIYETNTSTEEVTSAEPKEEELIIDANVIKGILEKLPIDNLDSSIDIGIGTRANGEFKDFYTSVNKGIPSVQEKSFDNDKTKVILYISSDTLVILYSTSKNSMCSTMQEEIKLGNIIYDTENMGILDTFKSGVSELRDCFEG